MPRDSPLPHGSLDEAKLLMYGYTIALLYKFTL